MKNSMFEKVRRDIVPAEQHMAESPRYPGTPRWVKVLGIIALVVVLLFVISLLTGVRHGPGLHTPPSSVREDYTPPSGDLGGHAPPEGGHG
jgi:hypothetical protein